MDFPLFAGARVHRGRGSFDRADHVQNKRAACVVRDGPFDPRDFSYLYLDQEYGADLCARPDAFERE